MMLVVATLLPASRSLAENNVFTESDDEGLNRLYKSALALEGDINQSASTVYSQQQVQCLLDLGNALDDIMAKLDAASDLVLLSAVMRDHGDEWRINSLLARRLPFALKQIALDRRRALNAGAYCSTSALVNTYAQKTVSFADDATAAISDINARVASLR